MKVVKERLYENESVSTSLSDKVGFHTNIEEDTIQNEYFRKVLYTGQNLQLVLMTLKSNEEIGIETHEDTDQFFRFDEGAGKCIINNKEYNVKDGDAIVVPAGAEHNIIASKKGLKMYTIYTPPHHKEGTIFKTKEEAEESGEDFDGQTTE